jgi:hypothetical protein
MGSISARVEQNRSVLVVGNCSSCFTLIPGEVTDEGRLLRAVRAEPGASMSEPIDQGRVNYTGFLEDEYQVWERLLEPTAANIAPLRASGFDWEASAFALAKEHCAPETIRLIRQEQKEHDRKARTRKWWQFWKS